MLKTWNTQRLLMYKNFITASCGFRRSGKSFTQAHILKELHTEFDLVISFCGSMMCSSDLQETFKTHLDERFMFDRINVDFLRKVMEQQENLAQQGIERKILMLFDDTEMDKNEKNFLGFFATRARHFSCSLMFSAVSYTALSKNFRRSLDILFLFSQPMYSDKKILLQEFSKTPRLADYCLRELEKYQCLVLENSFDSEMFLFKAPGNHPISQNRTDFHHKNNKIEELELLEQNEFGFHNNEL